MALRAPSSVVVLLSAAALLAAGCGSSDKSSSSGSSSTTSGTATSTGAGGGSSSQTSPNNSADRAAQACKQLVDRTGQLSGSAKKDLETNCDKAAHGDANAARKATEQACLKIAEQAIPAGSARDQAIAACKKAGP